MKIKNHNKDLNLPHSINLGILDVIFLRDMIYGYDELSENEKTFLLLIMPNISYNDRKYLLKFSPLSFADALNKSKIP
jgi:hypothetical protein